MSSRKKVIVVRLHPGQKAIVICRHRKNQRNRNNRNTQNIQPIQNIPNFPC
ncbi:hypothetical protein J2T12_000681 [Paenibacillus anaericanus]|nr:hypothetical protein [Paenibacillus anaericanus]